MKTLFFSVTVSTEANKYRKDRADHMERFAITEPDAARESPILPGEIERSIQDSVARSLKTIKAKRGLCDLHLILTISEEEGDDE